MFLREIQKIIMKQRKFFKFKTSFFQIIIYTFLLNNGFISSLVLADDKSVINSENFEDVFFNNDIKFEDVDSLDNQINSFFGIDYSLENKHFGDLASPFTSRDIRKMYDDKLIQMSVKESKKLNDDFFTDKL